ncbi:MAG: RNA 2',3'-cyclic phosphodiesterase [Hyphomicrobiales bacterium]|nr:RNA 2',3'-cyclic phosphodiesterase [Hyphomicrobiales bacterium]
MPRLFSGLQIPQDISQDLAQFRGGLPGARWIEPEDYHVTLRFIGDVSLGLAREIDAELAAIRQEPFDLRITGLDFFGGKKPRAIVAKVEASSEILALQASHERACRRAGAQDDTRKFQPHVTIARLRNTQLPDVGHYLHARSIARSWRFTAEEFVLFSARDSVGGGPYHVEVAYPLRSAAPALRPATNQ